MSLEDRIFSSFKDAVETFIRMGFEFTDDKRLIRNELEVKIMRLGPGGLYRTSVEKLSCIPIQNNHLNPVVATNANAGFIQKAVLS